MNVKSAVYIDFNFLDSKYKNRPGDGDAYFTYGFGSLYARKFKESFPDWEVQCWKADAFATKVLSKKIDGVDYLIFPARKIGRAGFISSSMRKHAKQYITENPKTVFNVSSFDHLLHYQISRLGKTNPIFVQHHGESPAQHKMGYSKGLKGLFWRFWSIIEKAAFERTHKVFLLDPGAAKFLPVSQEQVDVRTTGVDSKLFSPVEKKLAREKLGLKPDAIYLLFVGRLNASKRADMLIESYLKLRKEFSTLQLILGGSSQTDPLFKQAEDSGAIVKGMIPQQEMPFWLSAADIYSLPLLDTAHIFGGIGMLPVQAMFCNTPAVGSTLKCFPKEARDSVGICTSTQEELDEAIRIILSKELHFSNIREAALSRYSWESISSKTEKDYSEAIEKICL